MELFIAAAAIAVAVVVYCCLRAGDLEREWMEEMQKREEMDAGRTGRWPG